MVRTLIIDDEIRARETIQALLEIYCKDTAQVVGQAKNMRTGIEAIREHKPDLVLLDIKMPDGSGFDLLARYGKIDFKVVFITAFEEYAIQAFKFSAIDYILKPININEFISAVDKVVDKRTSNQNRNVNYEALLENIKSTLPGKLAIPTSDGMEYLNTKDIIRVEADRSYSWFYLKDRRKLLVSKNLKEYQELLSDRNFFRTHNSHLINLEHVKKYIRSQGGAIELIDGSQVPISRGKRDLFLLLYLPNHLSSKALFVKGIKTCRKMVFINAKDKPIA